MVVRHIWQYIDGDDTLALDWDLNEDSLVWEIGGYEGRWAWQMWEKFHCHITIFEPQDWAYKKLLSRFTGIYKVKIYPLGIWTKYGSFPLGNFFTDGASMLSAKEPVENSCLFVDYPTAFEIDRGQIDVGLMNIEGSEYTLIPEFIKSGYISRFENFWCQFHPDNKNDMRHIEIFEGMERTHEMLWDCYPTAVAWRRK